MRLRLVVGWDPRARRCRQRRSARADDRDRTHGGGVRGAHRVVRPGVGRQRRGGRRLPADRRLERRSPSCRRRRDRDRGRAERRRRRGRARGRPRGDARRARRQPGSGRGATRSATSASPSSCRRPPPQTSSASPAATVESLVRSVQAEPVDSDPPWGWIARRDARRRSRCVSSPSTGLVRRRP